MKTIKEYIIENLKPILIGMVLAFYSVYVFEVVENVIIKIALILNK